MNVVETRNLRKVFGEKEALAGLDLVIPQGSRFGLLGPNGAGKTTTIRILLGLAKATSGEAMILGKGPGQANGEVGYLPDVPGFYNWMSAAEFLDLAGGITNMPGDRIRKRIPELLELVGLAGVKTRVGGFSRGMKQRLGIAQALMNSPRLVILDEPTSALDPIGRKEILECIAGLKDITVIFSTHILEDVERVCDRAAVIADGKLLVNDTIPNLKAMFGDSTVAIESTDPAKLAGIIGGVPWGKVVGTEGSQLLISVTDLVGAEYGLPRLCAENGIGIRSVTPRQPSLEDAFVRLVEGGAA